MLHRSSAAGTYHGVVDEYWYQVWGPPRRPSQHPDCSFILPHLLVGEYPTPEDAAWLRDDRAVTSVVNLQDDGDLASKGLRHADLAAAYAALGMPFHRIPVPDCDRDTLQARLDDTVQLLADLVRDGHRVYLHCNAGLNRAPTMAVAYMHVHHGLSLAAACEFVRSRRNCVPYMRVLEAHYQGTTG